MPRSYMIHVDMGKQYAVDLAQARVVRPAHCEAGVVENPRAIRILEHEGPIPRAELAVMAAQRGDLHIAGATGSLYRRNDASDA